MTLDPPAPLSGFRRRAENRDEIPLGIADRAAAGFQLAEDVFQAHDRRRLLITAFAGAGPEQGQRRFPLRGRHFLEPQALARRPLLAVLEREDGFGPLLGRQAVE